MSKKIEQFWEKISTFIKENKLSAVLAHKDYGSATIIEDNTAKLILINQLETEKKYMEMRQNHIVQKWIEEELHKSENTNGKKENIDYMG